MKAYVDTNFLSRLYLRLPESDKIAGLLEQAERGGSPPLPVTWLHRMETLNAFELYVFAGRGAGHARVTPEQAAIAQATFREDLEEGTYVRRTQVDFEKLETHFEELSLRHTAKQGFRAYDVLHVASALLLECDTFWSFDPKASKLAALEGLRVL